MALEIAFYKVTEDIAIRSGLIAERYRTADNEHWILDNKDLSRVRFTADEYINGLSGVEKITENEAETLIALGGYKFGYEGLDDDGNVVIDEQEGETPLEQEQEVATIEDENGNIVDEHVVNNEEAQENGDKQEETEGKINETISSEDTGNVEEVLGGGDDEIENEANVEQENEEE